MANINFIKEVVGNPVTDAQGKEIPFAPIGGDCGLLTIEDTPENAARIEELTKLVGRFGIYKASDEEVLKKNTQPIWRKSVSPLSAPLREFQTSVPTPQHVEPVAAPNRAAPAPVAPIQPQAQEPAVAGQPRVIRPSMPRETGFPNNNAPQMPATPPAPILGSEFKPKTGSPKRSQSKLPTEPAAPVTTQ